MEPTDILKTQIGERVRQYRKQLSLTQEQLAYAIDSEKPYISLIETGKANITMSTLAAIANVLQVEPHQLLLPEENEE